MQSRTDTEKRQKAVLAVLGAAMDLVELQAPALAGGPFHVGKESFPHGLRVHPKTIGLWLAGTNWPTGNRLARCERFVEAVRRLAVRRGDVKASLAELLPAEGKGAK